MDVKVQFGKRLAQLRKERNMSQEVLSIESGIARSYLSGIERGQRNIALVNICKLAATLGVDPSVLMDFSSVAEEPAKPRSKHAKQKKPGR